MSDNGTIHWFPGHMMKTLRLIEADIKNVDIVVELLDARLPYSSKNPELIILTDSKPRLLLLNKSDLADDTMTQTWVDYYKSLGYGAMAIRSKDKNGAKKCVDAITKTLNDWLAANGRKPKGNKPRAMVVGIPNVGKSTFINMIAGTNRAKAEDRPGVTRGKQWITLNEIELLDMPGVLSRKLENQQGALKLAFTGSIKDDVLDKEEIAMCLLDSIKHIYAQKLTERFKLTQEQLELGGYDLLEAVAKNRGMLLSKGEYNTERAAITVLDELRAGKLGKITFEEPSDYDL